MNLARISPGRRINLYCPTVIHRGFHSLITAGSKKDTAGKEFFQLMIAIAPTLASQGERVHSLPANRAVE